MIIKSIELKNFRNYKEERIEFHEKLNFITGKNAQGKTNLIEAVNLLSMSKSFRTRREQEMISFDEPFFYVKGEFLREEKTHTVEIVLRKEKEGGKIREYRVNGADKLSVLDLLGGIYTVVFSPEDMRTIKGEPEGRRKFLDREIILLRPMYYHKLKEYKKILKNRNAILKEERLPMSLLDIFDEKLASAGAEIMRERKQYIEKLQKRSSKYAAFISGEAEKTEIIYKPNVSFSEEKKAEEKFLELLKKNRERDVFARTTESGPHRDDFVVLLNETDIRVFGSQGQQRTATLAMKMAELELIKEETGEDAILLLDDVMSELDEERQKKILSGLSENQIFITAAEESKIHDREDGDIRIFGDGKHGGSEQGMRTILIDSGRACSYNNMACVSEPEERVE